MRHGFLKVSACTPSIRVADCEYNAKKIIELMTKACKKGSRIAVFPELCITGYTCGDLFLQSTLLKGAENALKTIIEASESMDMVTAVGLPILYGSKLYNCAAIVHKGKLLGLVPKRNLPNYGEFYERRLFEPCPDNVKTIDFLGYCIPFGSQLLFRCRSMDELIIAAEICEDLWCTMPPSIGHAAAGATVILNLSASDETVGKADYRHELVSGQAARLICAYLYADAGEGESTTDMVFAGHDIIAENGTVLAESELFGGDKIITTEIDVSRLAYERRRNGTFPALCDDSYVTVDFEMETVETELTRRIDKLPFVPSGDVEKRCELIISIQAQGLKTRIERAYAKTAVVGISGGLDSCLALLVAVRAMDLMNRPHKDIIAVTMPCFGTTERTKNNAVRMSELLGVTLMTVDIGEAVTLHLRDIGHDINDHSVTYENAQARERTQVIMDIANRTGGMVIGTGDLSELALGWATYNGDHMSMYGVNASVPKTLIRYVVRYEADRAGECELRDVLYDIVATPVSPELLPAKDGEIAQRTEDIVGPYELHDFILYYAVRCGFEPDKVKRLLYYAFSDAYSKEELDKWLNNFYRRFFSQQFKRSCLPDGPKVGSLTLSPRGDWRMPSDASNTLWKNSLK